MCDTSSRFVARLGDGPFTDRHELAGWIDALRAESRSWHPARAANAGFLLANALMAQADLLGDEEAATEARDLLRGLQRRSAAADLVDRAAIGLALADAENRIFLQWLDRTAPEAQAAVLGGVFDVDVEPDPAGTALPPHLTAELEDRYRIAVAAYEQAIGVARNAPGTDIFRSLLSLSELHLLHGVTTGRGAGYQLAVGVAQEAVGRAGIDPFRTVDAHGSLAFALMKQSQWEVDEDDDVDPARLAAVWDCLAAVADGFAASGQDLGLLGPCRGAVVVGTWWVARQVEQARWDLGGDGGLRVLDLERTVEGLLVHWSERESVQVTTGALTDLVALCLVLAGGRDRVVTALRIVEEGRAGLLRDFLSAEEDAALAHRWAAAGRRSEAAAFLRVLDELDRVGRLSRGDHAYGAELTARQRLDPGSGELLTETMQANERLRADLRRRARLDVGAPPDDDGARIARAAARADEPLVYLVGPSGLQIRVRAGVPRAVALVVTTDREGQAGVAAVRLPGVDGPDVDAHLVGWHSAWTPELDLDEVEEMLGWLGRAVMEPVLAAAGRPASVTIVPGGPVEAFPLHAALVGPPAQDRFVLEETAVRYAPSAAALLAARRRADRLTAAAGGVAPARLIAVADPFLGPGAENSQLPSAAGEVREVARALGSADAPLVGKAATAAAVAAAFATAGRPELPVVVHLACHAKADPFVPLDSRLELARTAGEPSEFVLADLLDLRLGGVRLVGLSACETMVTGVEAPNQALSLAAGFLAAGAAGAFATQRPVNDIAGAVVSALFYTEWVREPGEPALALARAVRWLLTTPVADIEAWLAERQGLFGLTGSVAEAVQLLRSPAGWAPFVFVGA